MFSLVCLEYPKENPEQPSVISRGLCESWCGTCRCVFTTGARQAQSGGALKRSGFPEAYARLFSSMRGNQFYYFPAPAVSDAPCLPFLWSSLQETCIPLYALCWIPQPSLCFLKNSPHGSLSESPLVASSGWYNPFKTISHYSGTFHHHLLISGSVGMLIFLPSAVT